MLNDLKILVCIAFHFNDARLVYLKKVIAGLQAFPSDMKICIFTNTVDAAEQKQLISALSENARFLFEIYPVPNMGHPFMLPWAHKQVLKKYYEEDEAMTHFLYVEDDIEFTPLNMTYWLENRRLMHGTSFYPSLFRIEWNEKQQQWFSTDLLAKVPLAQSPVFTIQGIDYINLPSAYQGLTLYDRSLLAEHLISPSFDMAVYSGLDRLQEMMQTGVGYWNGRESANHGQTYIDVPAGFYSRNLIPFSKKIAALDIRCLVHHLPNNYTDNSDSEFGKIALNDLFID